MKQAYIIKKLTSPDSDNFGGEYWSKDNDKFFNDIYLATLFVNKRNAERGVEDIFKKHHNFYCEIIEIYI